MITDKFQVIDKESGAGQGKYGRGVTTTTTCLKVQFIGSILNSISFSLRDNHNGSQKFFQVWDSRKVVR